MTENIKNHEGAETYYLLVPGHLAAGLMQWWYEHDFECDLLVRRSKKNPGHVVMITKCTMFATTFYTTYKDEVKVTTKK